MTIAKKNCKIHYRRLRREGLDLPVASLSQLVTNALNKEIDGQQVKNSAPLRVLATSDSSQPSRLLNNCKITEDFVFGNTCAFAPGQMQALLELAKETEHGSLQDALETYDIKEQEARKGHAYVSGICYWLIVDDHFYQIQHTSLQAKHMEDYLTWLLKTQTAIIDKNNWIELQSSFDTSQVGNDLGDITSIEIGGIATGPQEVPSSTDAPALRAHEVGAVESLSSMFPGFEKAQEILTLLFGPMRTRELMSQIPDEAALDVKVNIGYKAKKRKFNKEFMGNIASGLRNLPDGEIQIKGKDGTVKGSDVRLSSDMMVQKLSPDSSLLNLEDALDQMLEVHRRFIHDGKIQP